MSRSWGKNLSYFACTSGLYTAATPWSQLCTGHPSTPKHKHQMHKILQMQKMQKKPSNNTWKQWTTPVPTASGPAVSLRDFSSPSAQIQKFNMQTESQFYLEGTAYFPCHLCYTTLSGDDCCKITKVYHHQSSLPPFVCWRSLHKPRMRREGALRGVMIIRDPHDM